VPKSVKQRGESQKKGGEASVLSEMRHRIIKMRITAKLSVWFPEKNFGFIHQERPDGEIVSIFLHQGNIKSGVPVTGADVRFKTVTTRKGQLAVDAEILDGGSL
jgi:cold shock CspA family protein